MSRLTEQQERCAHLNILWKVGVTWHPCPDCGAEAAKLPSTTGDFNTVTRARSDSDEQKWAREERYPKTFGRDP